MSWEPSQAALDEWGADATSFAKWHKRFGPRFLRVEHQAHEPVAFVECSECHAVVFEESFDNHRVWHNVRSEK